MFRFKDGTSIVVASFKKYDLTVADSIYKPVRVVNSARPCTC